jgi:hypothetical protein
MFKNGVLHDLQTFGRAVAVAALGFLGLSGYLNAPLMAGSLNLTIKQPDLSAGFLSSSYNATTGVLSASGWPVSFNLNGTSYSNIVGGNYTLTTQVAPNGQASSGSLDIIGTIPNLASSGTLLMGQLANFGFQPGGGDIFEFEFDVTGGDLAPYYHGQVDVILDAQYSTFTGSFANSFSATPYLGVADNGAGGTGRGVPEPSTFLLLLSAVALGLPVLAWRRLCLRVIH